MRLLDKHRDKPGISKCIVFFFLRMLATKPGDDTFTFCRISTAHLSMTAEQAGMTAITGQALMQDLVVTPVGTFYTDAVATAAPAGGVALPSDRPCQTLRQTAQPRSWRHCTHPRRRCTHPRRCCTHPRRRCCCSRRRGPHRLAAPAAGGCHPGDPCRRLPAPPPVAFLHSSGEPRDPNQSAACSGQIRGDYSRLENSLLLCSAQDWQIPPAAPQAKSSSLRSLGVKWLPRC